MINMNTEFGLSVLFDGFLAAIAAIGFAVISNPPKKAVFIAALLAAFGMLVATTFSIRLLWILLLLP